MTAKALMIMGTGSDVGKSLLVAGLCRILADRGCIVRPFKPQNMSNNAAVTVDGGEIGRAQALQARAARIEPTTAMNPVLLKPEHETGAQLVVRGVRRGSLPAREYFASRSELLPEVMDAFAEVAAGADYVMVEGAGSAAEINLRATDIANFGFARAANVPVVLAGDIDRGGVIASLVGTFAVIDPDDAALIRATLINRFRGDVALFDNGLAEIAARTRRPVFGPVPFFERAANLPAEDALGLVSGPPRTGAYRIAVPRLPRIANFDDLDPLRLDPALEVSLIGPGRPIPQDTDLIILPGSKSTRADLRFLRAEGWDTDIKAHHRAKKPILGICGGFQMLGSTIADPQGVEGSPGTDEGLGLLDISTVLAGRKNLAFEPATHVASGTMLAGYRMHMGATNGPDCARPFATIGQATEGATSATGLVMGTYLHGLFAGDEFRHAFFSALGALSTLDQNFEHTVEATLDAWAAHLNSHLNINALLALAGPIK